MAGVHPATASRALNQQTESLVNAETAARIKKVAAEMGYSPNPIARSLKTSRSDSIGLVIPDLTNPLFPPIVRGVEDVLRPSATTPGSSTPTADPTWRRRRSSRSASATSRASCSRPRI